MNRRWLVSLIAVFMMNLILTTVHADYTAEMINPDTSSWFVYDYPKPENVKGTPLDFSRLLDAPAGKHGFLNRTEGDNFVFQDETYAKFWGINLTSEMCHPDNNEAVRLAEQIAQNGFNAVRIHGLDSGYGDGIWGRKGLGSRVLRKEIMDRFCFLMAELKKRGIYIFLDQNVGRILTSDDNITDVENTINGAKEDGYYDRELIEWQKAFSEQLMNYYNSYTGLCLKDDPAIAMVQLKNEDAIVSSQRTVPDYYYSQLQKLFNEWLLERYGNREALETAWGSPNGLATDESPEDNTVQLPDWLTRNSEYSRKRRADSAEFLAEIQADYYAERIEHMRQIGVKCVISGATGWAGNGVERETFYSQLGTDFIDSHQYFSNTGGSVYTDGAVRSDSPQSMMDLDYSLVNRVAIRNVYGMPHTVSEWNEYAPSLYRGQSFLMMASYSALQGAHPFAFYWSELPNTVTTQNFSKKVLSMNNPETMAAMPATAAVYLRGDAAEAESGFYPLRLRGQEPFVDYYEYMEPKYKRLFEPYLGYVGKTGMIFEDKAYSEKVQDDAVYYSAKQSYEKGLPYVSVTGEMSTDTVNEIFKLNTERSQAVSGMISGQRIELDDIIVNVSNACATVYLTALQSTPVWKADSLLLTVTGDSRNTGMQLSQDGKTIIKAGTAPVLVEPVCGTVILKTSDTVRVYPLNSSGQRTGEKTVTKTENGYSSFQLEASDKAMHYEIVRTSSVAVTANPHISFETANTQLQIPDVTENHTNYPAIRRMVVTGCAETDADGRFLPDGTVTKRDFIKMLMRAMRFHENEWYRTTYSDFSDLGVNDDGYPEMAIALNLKIISMKSGQKIYPDEVITRADAMEYTAKAVAVSYKNLSCPPDFSLNTSGDYSSCAQQYGDKLEYFRTVIGLGYMDLLNGKIAPNELLVRSQAAELTYRLAWK